MLIMDTTTLEQLQAQVRERISRIRDHEEATSELLVLQDALKDAHDDVELQCAILNAWLEMTEGRYS